MAPTERCSTGAAFYPLGQARRSATMDNAARRSQMVPVGHRARLLALLGVSIFLMSIAVAACGSATSARTVSSGFTGYDWQVVAISHDGKVTRTPARMQVALQFSPGGQFGANDGINFHSGTYRTTSDGFTTSALASTAVGYAGHDPDVLVAIDAIRSFDNGVHATVRLTADRLVIGVDSYTLTCQRSGPQADVPAPAGRHPPTAGAAATRASLTPLPAPALTG